MRILPSKAVLFLLLVFVISWPGMAATLNNSSLQGTYSFAINKVDTPVLGFFFTSAFGTITFNGNGAAAVQGTINRNGSVQALSASGTYTLDSGGGFQLSVPNLPMAVSGSVSFDLNSLLATNVAGPNTLTHETLLAVRRPAQPMELASLTGSYFLVQQTVTATGATPQRENSSGTIDFDGAGAYTLSETVNRGGSVSTIIGSGAYQVTPGGTVTLGLTGRPDPVMLAFAPGSAFGVGTTVSESSSNIHDLFVLTKADSTGLGTAALGGAHQVVVNAVDSMGFSTSMGRALYFGDGRAFYELLQNRMGVLRTTEENSTVEVAADGEIRLSSVPDVAGLSQGGLGLLGHNVAAAAVSDPAVHSFLVAIRTPSQPIAASNAASFSSATALTPGALVSLFGTNLARQTVVASSLPLPKQMGGASVKINGIEAPLHAVSPFQINAQVPFEVSPGTAEITAALDDAEGSSLEVSVGVSGPGIFTHSLDGQGIGIFLHGSDFSLITESSPARPGEIVLIYGTGLGSVVPNVASGAAAPGDPLAHVTASISVQVAGRDAEVSFAGLAPGFVGLYQVNVRIPPDTAPAPDVSVVAAVGGVDSNTVTIPVAP